MTSDCIEWKGAVNSSGYSTTVTGSRTDGSRRHLGRHRLAWELVNGPIPERMCVCHKCDNPRCYNPEHLFLGTHSDNARDMIAKGRRTE